MPFADDGLLVDGQDSRENSEAMKSGNCKHENQGGVLANIFPNTNTNFTSYDLKI